MLDKQNAFHFPHEGSNRDFVKSRGKRILNREILFGSDWFETIKNKMKKPIRGFGF